ncbi:hypothetical protein [Pseudonocardia sp. DLS-67]
MSTIVVDASVALKWTVTEPGSDAANALLERNALLVAPEHLLGEVGNGRAARARAGRSGAGGPFARRPG